MTFVIGRAKQNVAQEAMGAIDGAIFIEAKIF